VSRKALTSYLLAAIFVLLIAAALFFTLRHRGAEESGQPLKPPEQSEAEFSISRFTHTASRDGKTEWELEAASAEYFASNSRVRLKEVSMTFFAEPEEPPARLSAREGIFYVNSRDITVSGNVTAENERYRLKTETLHYEGESHIMLTETPVQIYSATAELRADSMRFNLDTGELVCSGNVNGSLRSGNLLEGLD
jgi:LPS export ABC transporter protein LptC